MEKFISHLSDLGLILLRPVLYFVAATFWGIFISFPFLFLHGLFTAAEFFSFDLVNIILFGKKDALGSYGDLPPTFIAFAIYALFFLILFVIIGLIRYNWNSANTDRQLKFRQILAQSAKALVFILLLPFILFLFNYAASLLLKFLTSAVSPETGNTGSIAGDIYNSINQLPKGYSNLFGEFSNSTSFVYYSPTSSLGNVPTFGPPKYEQYVMMPQMDFGLVFIKNMIIAWGLVIFLAGIVVSLVQLVLQQITLLILAPISAAKSVEDNGKALMLWKRQYIEISLGMFVNILSLAFFQFFMTIIPPLIKANFDWGLRFILEILAYVGIAVATKGLHRVISKLLDINIEDGDGWKTIKKIARTGFEGIKAGAMAGSAVASGGATLGAQLAKGGVMNTIGALGGKVANMGQVMSNKRRAKKMGMSKGLIREAFGKTGNVISKQNEMLDKFGDIAKGDKNALSSKENLIAHQKSKLIKEAQRHQSALSAAQKYEKKQRAAWGDEYFENNTAHTIKKFLAGKEVQHELNIEKINSDSEYLTDFFEGKKEDQNNSPEESNTKGENDATD
ncbi:Mbov_0396 family ICE element transmembrane protein [[Mycoplasma] anseris]|uniref:Transmembrane protein n=1 Tax=[Mycoplasma] anseris TaxID=92400 RepID=A0A2Z4NDH7_9BACT|nr:hypothetical protein [[Mycoplasma] anseris]AWX69558.1 hypothetical protein DP065_02220 [[Mycoplasma] anseris]